MSNMEDYKSPYGKVVAMMARNTVTWIMVETPEGHYRYFTARNWTYFEKDMATEITEEDFENMATIIRDEVVKWREMKKP